MADKPTIADVVLGRGVGTTRHPGNQHFRSIVSEYVTLYATSTKKQKMMLSRSIVDNIRATGRFLEKDGTTGRWREVDDRRALEKTAQALRDGAFPIRKRLMEDMNDPAFLDSVFENDYSTATAKPRNDHSTARARGRVRPSLSRSMVVKRSSLSRSLTHTKGNKHRRTKSLPCIRAMKRDPSPGEAKEQYKAVEVRSAGTPVKEETQNESAMQLPDVPRSQLSTEGINATVTSGPQAGAEPSIRQPDDYEPLPFNPRHGEYEMATSANDLLRAAEILSDTGIQRRKTLSDGDLREMIRRKKAGGASSTSSSSLGDACGTAITGQWAENLKIHMGRRTPL